MDFRPAEPGTKHKVRVHAHFYVPENGRVSLFVDNHKMDPNEHFVYVGPIELEYVIPEGYDIRVLLSAGMQEIMQKARAEFEATMTAYQRRLNSILALEA